MPPELTALLDGAAKLGALGLSLIGIFALATGRVRVGTLVDADKAAALVAAIERLKEVQTERDDWKSQAQILGPELKRLNDLLDTAVKLLLDPTRRPPA